MLCCKNFATLLDPPLKYDINTIQRRLAQTCQRNKDLLLAIKEIREDGRENNGRF